MLETSTKCLSSDSHFFDIDKKCLLVVQETKTFELAQQECQQRRKGGHLIWLLNEQKVEWLKSRVMVDLNGIWLGANLDNSDGALKWTPNGTLMDVKFFNDDVIENHNEDESKLLWVL